MIDVNSKEFLLQVSLIELLISNNLKNNVSDRIDIFYTNTEKTRIYKHFYP
jgi:hypothetical protein